MTFEDWTLIIGCLVFLFLPIFRPSRPAIPITEATVVKFPIKLPHIDIDFGEAFDLAPDVAEFVGLLIKAKSRKSDGGRAITPAEKKKLLAKLKEIGKELGADAKD